MASPAALKTLKVSDFDYTYLDSGAPATSDYTTWVTIHGLGFNGAVFEKLLPIAAAHKLRIITVNRRGYPPSSGFQDHELMGIGPGKKFEEAEPFLRGQGIEIATFLVKLATERGIPLINPDRPTGGIVLIGWSLGTVYVTSLLAYLDELPEDTRSTLQKYLHTILYHDSITGFFGIPATDKHRLTVWSVTDDNERFSAFSDWATAHYANKSVTSGNIDDLRFDEPSDMPHSFHELSPEQRAKYTHIHAFLPTGCDGKLTACDSTAFAALAKRALFDKTRAEKSFNVRVRFTTGGTSEGVFVWSAWALRKYVEDPPEALFGSGAAKARDIKFLNQTEGNHFAFWDDPEKAIQQYSAAINL